MTPPARAARASALAPFRVRSFRFQWPADFATSWAFEMEALILGWYVLTSTGSVQQLVIFGALGWLGSLFSPFFGVAGSAPRAAGGNANAAAAKPLAGLKQAVRYVCSKPELLGAICMAFLVNLLAFPFFLGLLPYVAKDVYGIGQSGLGYAASTLIYASLGLAATIAIGFSWRRALWQRSAAANSSL
ncbi:MAG: hypothetical protein EXR33_09190 [Betaproteobacteria bacterium]|nr:hypothetical protein [Betaproteobacteria bacterium]